MLKRVLCVLILLQMGLLKATDPDKSFMKCYSPYISRALTVGCGSLIVAEFLSNASSCENKSERSFVAWGLLTSFYALKALLLDNQQNNTATTAGCLGAFVLTASGYNFSASQPTVYSITAMLTGCDLVDYYLTHRIYNSNIRRS